ncbi:unnamed protein product [Calicophoron daubneyi]|uniref:Uncharacterized protein n=1 Tax=Calicophoron daubneyi TaxID=300641 RepID=A0AAV2TJD8_CALDB
MAKPDGVGLEVPLDNIVAKDKIWRDHCLNEAARVKLWRENWGFLTQTKEELLKDEIDALRDRTRKRPEMPDSLKISEPTPTSEYFSVKPSPKPFPQTTSQEIGWRSGRREFLLDKYDLHRKAQGCLLRRFNWPVQAIW